MSLFSKSILWEWMMVKVCHRKPQLRGGICKMVFEFSLSMTVTARNVFNCRSTRFVDSWGSNPTHGMNMSAFIVCLLPCIGKGPTRDRFRAQNGSTNCLKGSRVWGINFELEPWKKDNRYSSLLAESLMLELYVFLPRRRQVFQEKPLRRLICCRRN
jgi:hypothetical protein